MLTVEEALTTVLAHVSTGTQQEISLPDCLYRILGEDLSTPHDSPPFDKSMMDGFAVCAAGFEDSERKTLQIRETITAGIVPVEEVTHNSTSRIMTGSLIPVGADCVVPVELTQVDENSPDQVTIAAADAAPERNILRRGVSARQGMPLMAAGTLLEPQHIAVLAEFGIATVPVYRRPTVAVLATGDELLPIDQPLTPGHIRNSNEPMLVSQIQRAHAAAVPLGVARDNRAELRERIQRGLECDFLLLSGGVSAGTLDLVPSELAAAGVKQVFHKIHMKPGKPLWFGQYQADGHTCWVFGLPGNPVSSMICFEIFVRSALRKNCGLLHPEPQVLKATLTESVAVRGDRPTYFPARLAVTNSGLTAAPVPWGGSADLRSTADANGMCLLAPQPDPYIVGQLVETVLW